MEQRGETTFMPIQMDGLADHYTTALVTGASSGIGLAVAQQLQKAGLAVTGTTRQPDRDGLPGDIRWVRFDGSTPDGISSFISENADLLATVNVLINNAGSSIFGHPSAIPADALSAQQSLLLDAPVQLSREVLDRRQPGHPTVIINVSSLAALFPLPYMGAYSACKAGLSAFTRTLMVTGPSDGLVCIDFQPGDFRTAFNRNIRRYGEADARETRAWKRFERNLLAAPPPEQAAADLMAAIRRGRSGTIRSGSWFQRVLAPVGYRLLPGSWVRKAVQVYYGIG